jgi:uncharacterized SAM-binding protein YcdF (DUF218 family)
VKKRSRIFKILIIFLILFPVWIFAAPFLATVLIIEKPLEKADAIFILGGSSTYKERTQKAAKLFNNGVAEKIFLTDDGTRGGWSKTEKRNPPFAELAKNELVKQGVPAEKIEILEPQVTGTIYEAQILNDAAKSRKLDSVLLVTSAYHTRRAFWICDKILRENGAEISLGIESAETGIDTPPPQMWWLKPKGWEFVAGEYVKTIAYWVYY